MRDHLDRLGDAAVAAVSFSDPARLPDHRRHLDLPFPVLADPDRALYRAFDLGRGRLHRVWGPTTLARYATLLRRGRRLRRPVDDDTRQLGGDIVIGPDGRLGSAFRPDAPDRRPTIDELITAVDRVRVGD